MNGSKLIKMQFSLESGKQLHIFALLNVIKNLSQKLFEVTIDKKVEF